MPFKKKPTNKKRSFPSDMAEPQEGSQPQRKRLAGRPRKASKNVEPQPPAPTTGEIQEATENSQEINHHHQLMAESDWQIEDEDQ